MDMNLVEKHGMLQIVIRDSIFFWHCRIFDADKCISLIREMICRFSVCLSDSMWAKILGVIDEML